MYRQKSRLRLSDPEMPNVKRRLMAKPTSRPRAQEATLAAS